MTCALRLGWPHEAERRSAGIIEAIRAKEHKTPDSPVVRLLLSTLSTAQGLACVAASAHSLTVRDDLAVASLTDGASLRALSGPNAGFSIGWHAQVS